MSNNKFGDFENTEEIIKEFVKSDNPEIYDFRYEYPWDSEPSDDSIMRLLQYKTLPSPFDCDCCDLANAIYKTLWKCVPNPNYQRWNPRYELGDFKDAMDKHGGNTPCDKEYLERETMNSFFTTFKFVLQVCLDKKIGFRKWPYLSCIKSCITEIEESCKYIKDEYSELYEKLYEYAGLTNSIGNFTLLINPNPKTYEKGFNPGRALKTYDYWDLSLELLKRELNNEKLFASYKETFYLNDVKNSQPIEELFEIKTRKKNMTWTPSSGEDGVEQLSIYLEHVNNRIKARGEKMVSKLREKVI